jgi:hypothetical protein
VRSQGVDVSRRYVFKNRRQPAADVIYERCSLRVTKEAQIYAPSTPLCSASAGAGTPARTRIHSPRCVSRGGRLLSRCIAVAGAQRDDGGIPRYACLCHPAFKLRQRAARPRWCSRRRCSAIGGGCLRPLAVFLFRWRHMRRSMCYQYAGYLKDRQAVKCYLVCVPGR